MEKTNTAPGVSVIVPIYKAEKYFKRCLESIQNQTFEDLEIILVDDESPDACPFLCDEAAAVDPRIRVIHKTNQGPGLARNSGLEIARGIYVYFADADDYLDKTAVETLYMAAKKEKLDLCFAGFYLLNGGKAERKIPKYAGSLLKQPQIVREVLTDMLGTAPEEKADCTVRMAVWQGIYRRSWLLENGIRFASNRRFLSEDILFHMDCLPLARRMRYLPECLYYHTEDNLLSWTHRYQSDYLERYGEQYLAEIEKTDGLDGKEEMRRRIQRTYIGNARICIQQLVGAADDISRRDRKKELKRLSDDPILQSVLREYPYWRTPWKQRTLSFFLRYRRCGMVFWLTWAFVLVRKK